MRKSKCRKKHKNIQTKTNKYNGGMVLINNKYKNADEAFDKYVENSEISILSENSESGVLLKFENKSKVEPSYYTVIESTSNIEPTTDIVIKMLLLQGPVVKKGVFNFFSKYETPINIDECNIHTGCWLYGDKEKKIETLEGFEKELLTQIDVTNKTIDCLNLICPVVLFSKKYNNKCAIKYIDQLANKCDAPAANALNQIKKVLQTAGSTIFLGIIAMEMENNFEGLDIIYQTNNTQIETDLQRDYRDDWTKYRRQNAVKINMDVIDKMENAFIYAIYNFILLAVKTQFIHGDNHMGNVMYDGNKAIIIDFGLADKIPETDVSTILKLWEDATLAFKNNNTQFAAASLITLLDVIYRLTIQLITKRNPNKRINEINIAYDWIQLSKYYNKEKPDWAKEKAIKILQLNESITCNKLDITYQPYNPIKIGTVDNCNNPSAICSIFNSMNCITNDAVNGGKKIYQTRRKNAKSIKTIKRVK